MKYIDLSYKPNKNDLITSFYVEPATDEVFEAIASESSIGTWTFLSTLTPKVRKKLGAKVFFIDKKNKIVKIAYPSALFEKGNMPQILSSIAGNIFGMKAIKNLRLEDIKWPYVLIKSFSGPKYGIQGIRKILGIKKRPLVGSILKPKVGLSPKEQANNAYLAWKNGIDVIKEDENLGDLEFNRFKERVIETLKMKRKAEKETGEGKAYIPNITAETNEMIKRAKFVERAGGRHVMVDIITVGWSALQTLRNENLNLILHGHRSGHAAMTKGKHGISMLVIADIARLIGIDQLHIGTVVGKMIGEKEEVVHIGEEIEKRFIKENKKIHTLAENWYNVKPVMAICSGGLHPAHIPHLVKYLGNDIICQFGGGLWGHKMGGEAGARAIRQALEATLNEIPLKDYAKKHIELKTALEQWT
nr:RuBisCO long chain, Form III-b [uncultured archaeon]